MSRKAERERLSADIPLETMQRLDALVERRPGQTRTSIVALLIHDAFDRLTPAEQTKFKRAWNALLIEPEIPATYVDLPAAAQPYVRTPEEIAEREAVDARAAAELEAVLALFDGDDDTDA